MSKLDFHEVAKIKDFLKKKEKEDKACNVLVWVLAIIGVVAAVAGIAYAIYRYTHPDYLEELDEEFEDEFAEEDNVFEEEI